MKIIIIILLCSILFSGCIPSTANKNTKAKICSDERAINFSKPLPCQCAEGETLSLDKKNCIQSVKELTRACLNQPQNTDGGVETSYDRGLSWSSCAGMSCLNSYTSVNDICVPLLQTKPCVVMNGEGVHTSQDGGQTWNSCTPTGCNRGHILQGDQCIQMNNTRVCSVLNGVGIQTTSNAGLSWSTCVPSRCSVGYMIVNGACVLSNQTRSCSILNGVGNQFTNDAGLHWSVCELVSCNSGFHQDNNSCTFTPVSRMCTIENGNGTQNQSTYNGPWSLCTVSSCNAGYTSLSNRCQVSTINRNCTNQPAHSTAGYEWSEDAGQSWGSVCKNFSCLSSAIMINGQCVLNVEETPILDFSYYVAKFEEIAILENRPTGAVISISLTTDFEDSGILGTCTYANPRFIKIRQNWWLASTTSNLNRQYVLFHELGHCILDRTHKSDSTTMADYPNFMATLSIMYPALISKDIYKNNIDYYHKELFDETASTQNIPMYYYSNRPEELTKFLTAPLALSSRSQSSTMNGEFICGD